MSLLLLVVGVALLAFPAGARQLGRRLPPDQWARLAAAALAAGVLLVEVSLVLLAAPTVLRTLGVPALASACGRMFGELTPGGTDAGWSAAALAVVVPGLALRGAARGRRAQRSMWVEPWLGDHTEVAGVELVVLASTELFAYSVARPTPQVVLSQGLVDALDRGELAAITRHELAHLQYRHHRQLLLAAAIETSMPILCLSTAPLRVALERWADETAAGASRPRRRTVREALLALAACPLASGDVAAFGAVPTIFERIDALDAAPITASRAPHAAMLAVLMGLGLVALVGAGQWVVQARAMLAMAGYCAS